MNKEIETLIEETEQYGSSKIELTRLETVEKTVDYASFTMSWLVILGFLSICLLFLSGAAVVLLAEIINSYLIAFTIVGGFYLLISLLLFMFRKTALAIPIKNFLFGKVLSLYSKENDKY